MCFWKNLLSSTEGGLGIGGFSGPDGSRGCRNGLFFCSFFGIIITSKSIRKNI